MAEQTLGQRRMRPELRELTDEEKALVLRIKTSLADWADELEAIKQKRLNGPDIISNEKASDIARWTSIAQADLENASMYAVKAVTA